jgi:gamma-butyrobetaine dioxygenase
MTSTTNSFKPSTELPFPPLWLRDNCPCQSCRDPRSNQKLFQFSELPTDITVTDVHETENDIMVTFAPDGHCSTFSRQWLVAQSSITGEKGRTEQEKRLWRAQDIEQINEYSNWLSYQDSDVERLRVLRQIETLGFAILHDTPTVERTVLMIAETFGFVRETNYGELFEVRVEPEATNLAFTGRSIAPHTDNPYRDPAPTMQLLHCLSNSVVGGDSGLVDGFQAAAILREERRHHFDLLARTPVTFAWADTHNSLEARRPVIELDELGRVRTIRFNNRSMQALRMEFNEVNKYYEALRSFEEILSRPDMAFTFSLEPGDCVIFDNTRLLHSRTAFSEADSGQRRLQGCYADLDGLGSTVAVLERTN